uniref:Uncharacterized protein n=1 Tax=Cricetulus griseus TaxID=10029 RepID=A0A8C2QI15_CRIGR
SIDLPRLTTAESQLCGNLTKIKPRSEERGVLNSPNKGHQTITVSSEIKRTYSRQTDALMSLRSCRRGSFL